MTLRNDIITPHKYIIRTIGRPPYLHDTLRIQDRIIRRCRRAVHHLDICLFLHIWAVFPWGCERYTIRQSVSCGSCHRSECFPSKTTGQFRSKICIYRKHTLSRAFCSLRFVLGKKTDRQATLGQIFRRLRPP